MILGHQATALTGIEVRRAQPGEQGGEGLAGTLCATARDEQRPPGRPQQVDGRLNGTGLGRDHRCALRCEMLRQLNRQRHLGAQRIHREVEVHRTGLAAVAERPGHRLVQFLQHQLGLPHGAGVAGDRAHQIGMNHVLQRAAVLLGARRRARQHQHRRPRDIGVGDAGHGIGHAGAGGDQRDAEAAGELRFGVGHIDRRAFVAHVDDADAFGVEAHPQRHDVAAAQGVDALDAALLQEARDDGGGGLFRDALLGVHGVSSRVDRPGVERARRPYRSASSVEIFEKSLT